MADEDIKQKSAIAVGDAVSRETGLGQYEGDEKIYADVLKNFTKNNKSTLRKLKEAINVGDMALAYRIAHSLRGAAGAIGATRLASAAFSVESKLLPANVSEADVFGGKDFSGQMILLENEFDAVFHELEASVLEDEEIRRHPGVMDRNKTVEMIDKIIPFLETGDTKCLEYLEEIEDAFRPAAEGFKLFITQIESYDFEQAYEIIESIRRFMMT